MDELNIAVIDDDPFIHLLVTTALSGIANVECYESGPVALEHIPALSPDLVLLDVHMPELDGYEVCRRLKMLESTQHIPVIFLSAHGNLSDMEKGYEAGGEDYLIKPIENSVLVAKVQAQANIKREHQQSTEKIEVLQQSADMATNAAKAALNTAGDISVLVSFLEKAQKCVDQQTLGKELLVCLNNFELQGNVEIRIDDEVFYLASDDVISPLHVELINRHSNKGRLFSQGRFLTVNYHYLSLLVRNMPIEDEDKCGRLKDIVNQLVSAANSRVNSIAANKLLLSQQKEMGSLVLVLNKLAKKGGQEIWLNLDETVVSLEQIAHALDMPAVHEKSLLEVVEKITKAFNNIQDNMTSIETKFDHLIVHQDEVMKLLNGDHL